MRILLASIYPYAFLLLYLTIPFDNYIRALPNILLGVLVVAFPIIVTKKDFKKLLIKPTLLFLLFFAFLFLNSFISGRMADDFVVIKKMLIPLGLVILYIPVQDFKKLNKAIIFSSLAAIVFSLVKFLILVNRTGDFNITLFQETIDVLLIDRLYIGFLCILSILVSYQSLKNKYNPYNSYYLTNIIINILYVFLIMSKVAIVILIAIVLLRQFYGKQKKIRMFISIGLIVLIGGIGISKYKYQIEKIIDSKENIAEINYIESTMPWEYRTLIWNCAYKISQNSSNSFFGIGFKKTNKQLLICYENEIKDLKTKQNFISKKFNTHNQYFDFYLSEGILGLILFLGVLIALFMQYRKQFFPTALLVSIIIFGLTENFFHRQIGAYYFGFILVMLLINNTFFKDSKKESILNQTKENLLQ